MSLARRNQARGFIHPGFVVLDSPVLTYRRPEDNKDGDELLAYDVVKNFYSDLVDNPVGQVIVIENGTPPKSVKDQAAVYAFSVDGSTRQGFFPPRDSS